jgi:hypothetical protein
MKPLRAGVGVIQCIIAASAATGSCKLLSIDSCGCAVQFSTSRLEKMKQHSPDVLIRTGQSSINCVVIWEVISNQERSCQCWLNLNDNRSL